MHVLRRILTWFFSFSALTSLAFVVLPFAMSHRIEAGRPTHHSFGIGFFLISGFSAAFFGMAWWTNARQRPHARGWGLAASAVYALIGIGTLLSPRIHGSSLWTLLTAGILGLIAYARPFATPLNTRQTMPKVPGDGTSDLLNKGASAFSFIGYLVAWYAAADWMHRNHIPSAHSGILILLLLCFLSTLAHELGHTTIGLAVGMKLRSFSVGPFQWRVSEGKWKFTFKLAAIVTDAGAVGVVPTTANPPRWHAALMIAAGPLTNLYCGLLAAALTFVASTPDYIGYGLVYPLAAFTLINLFAFLVNLIPVRSGVNYSDGAQLYQLLSNGPWADLHRSVALVTSTLVTPLQPRDYDIETISRAAEGITQGTRALMLRIWAYSHYLDRGRLELAASAIEDAEAVCKASVPDLPAELHAVFIFANAYVRHDAAAARQWWDRMQAKKPTNFNVDYLRAQSALHWAEGNLSEAQNAWKKSTELAEKLPRAGAYEFDRTCCKLLGRELEQSVAA